LVRELPKAVVGINSQERLNAQTTAAFIEALARLLAYCRKPCAATRLFLNLCASLLKDLASRGKTTTSRLWATQTNLKNKKYSLHRIAKKLAYLTYLSYV